MNTEHPTKTGIELFIINDRGSSPLQTVLFSNEAANA